ncbi:MAG TPA: YdeI/OmpD-associated family protein [Hanamia sp.]|nr:YdeI/OmpD-associated family protein [Hanamia sp.]
MANKDKRIDVYIANSPDFARPILIHLRDLVHAACPNVEETIRWGFPHFDHKGIMCSLASFKNHCAFGFWKASLMKDAEVLKYNNQKAMGHAGKIQSLPDLLSDKIIILQIKEAMKLNEDGIKLPERKNEDKKPVLITPDILKKELVRNRKASNTYKNLSFTHKNEYIEWIEEAKNEATKQKRILTTIEWLMEGKTRNWKYDAKNQKIKI